MQKTVLKDHLVPQSSKIFALGIINPSVCLSNLQWPNHLTYKLDKFIFVQQGVCLSIIAGHMGIILPMRSICLQLLIEELILRSSFFILIRLSIIDYGDFYLIFSSTPLPQLKVVNKGTNTEKKTGAVLENGATLEVPLGMVQYST